MQKAYISTQKRVDDIRCKLYITQPRSSEVALFPVRLLLLDRHQWGHWGSGSDLSPVQGHVSPCVKSQGCAVPEAIGPPT